MFQQMKRGFLLISLVYILFGACLLIRPTMAASILCMLAGAALGLVGIFKILLHFFQKKDNAMGRRFSLSIGMFMLLLGILLLLHPETLLGALPVVLGILVLTDGVIKLETALELRRAQYPRWWLELILSGLCAALGAVMIWDPSSTALFMRLLGLSIALIGVCDAVFTLYIAHQLKKQNRLGDAVP